MWSSIFSFSKELYKSHFCQRISLVSISLQIIMLKEKLKVYELEKMSIPENRNTGTLINQQQEEILRYVVSGIQR